MAARDRVKWAFRRVKELSEQRFEALAGYTRRPDLVTLLQEAGWFATTDERACSPAPANRTQIATHAKELLEHRAAIHKQERLVASLRSDLAVRSQWVARSDDKLRALGGELADVRKRLDDVAKQAADVEKEAACAGDVAARALDDKELAVRRGEGALRRLQRRHERELDKRDREHDAEREARAGELADLRACVSRESRDLAGVRADLAASVAAHARDLTSAKKMREQALAEQQRGHAERARDQAGVDAEAIAAREHAHADELALVRAAAALTVEMHLRETEQAEQSLASARARHEREADSLRLQLTSLREAAAAEQRLAQHAMALLARAPSSHECAAH